MSDGDTGEAGGSAGGAGGGPGRTAGGRAAEGRIGRRFRELREEGRVALVPFLTAGFPDPAGSLDDLLAVADAGADVLELGIPFSDPLADGPTIQRSSFRSLEAGTTVGSVLELLARFRERRDTPVVLFTYLNPLLRRGAARFAEEAREAGADGVLVTDLPAGSDPEVEEALRGGGLDLVRLVAPTTPPERIRAAAEGGGGFVYYVSRTGVTGERESLRTELAGEVGRVRDAVGLPVAVGFGISGPEQAAEVARTADGVVVGSALVRRLEEEGRERTAAFVRSLRDALDGAAATRG